MKKNHLYFFIAVLSMFSSCKKDDGLTKITKEGLNTFSCKIDGNLFVPKGLLFTPEPIYVIPGPDEFYLLVGDYATPNNTRTLTFTIREQIKEQTYDLNSVNTVLFEQRANTTVFIEYTTDNSHRGEITFIRADHINKIYSGTFNVNVVNSQGVVVHITKGRFDVKRK